MISNFSSVWMLPGVFLATLMLCASLLSFVVNYKVWKQGRIVIGPRAAVQTKTSTETWGQWIRKGEVFDKLLLLAWIVWLIVIILHVTHDKADETVVQWYENLANTVSGTLIGIITGRRMSAADSEGKPAQSQTLNLPNATVGTVVQGDSPTPSKP